MDLMEIKFESIAFDRYTNFSSFRAHITRSANVQIDGFSSFFLSNPRLPLRKIRKVFIQSYSWPRYEAFRIIFIYLTEKINA